MLLEDTSYDSESSFESFWVQDMVEKEYLSSSRSSDTEEFEIIEHNTTNTICSSFSNPVTEDSPHKVGPGDKAIPSVPVIRQPTPSSSSTTTTKSTSPPAISETGSAVSSGRSPASSTDKTDFADSDPLQGKDADTVSSFSDVKDPDEDDQVVRAPRVVSDPVIFTEIGEPAESSIKTLSGWSVHAEEEVIYLDEGHHLQSPAPGDSTSSISLDSKSVRHASVGRISHYLESLGDSTSLDRESLSLGDGDISEPSDGYKASTSTSPTRLSGLSRSSSSWSTTSSFSSSSDDSTSSSSSSSSSVTEDSPHKVGPGDKAIPSVPVIRQPTPSSSSTTTTKSTSPPAISETGSAVSSGRSPASSTDKTDFADSDPLQGKDADTVSSFSDVKDPDEDDQVVRAPRVVSDPVIFTEIGEPAESSIKTLSGWSVHAEEEVIYLDEGNHDQSRASSSSLEQFAVDEPKHIETDESTASHLSIGYCPSRFI